MKAWMRSVPGYLLALVMSLALLVVVLQLWKADLRVPFLYSEDALLVESWVKGVLDNGWYLHNPYLAAPAAQDFHDFPMADNLHFFVIKVLGFFFSSYETVINLYFLLTFPLTALTALVVFRHFGVAYLPSLCGALLFAFLPYHFFRNEGHLFLAAYYLVPLAVMVALWVLLSGVEARPLAGRRAAIAVVVCLLASSAGVYYAAFSCFFLLVAGSAAALRYRRLGPLATSGFLIGVTVAGGLANLAPSLAYQWRHGYNASAVERGRVRAEMYGLKITQLLLPATSHRIPAVARFKDEYNRRAPLVNENDSASLGLIGSCGFVALVGLLLVRRTEGGPPSVAQELAFLNLFAILLAGMGGFGALFCLIMPWIRDYNRISVFIGFFSLFAVVLFLDRFARRFAPAGRARVSFAAGLAALTVFGVWDQTPTSAVPDYLALRRTYEADAVFVRTIEASLPAGAAVFQLPYVPFPEAPRDLARTGPYDHLRPYLHSRRLCWSFGGVKGREADRWYRETACQSPPELIRSLAGAGFGGVWVDTSGYADGCAACVAELHRLLGTPLTDDGRRVAFFPLAGGPPPVDPGASPVAAHRLLDTRATSRLP